MVIIIKAGTVAVEENLTNVRQELDTSGYEIVDMHNENLQNVDAVIISGEDNNMMNMSDIATTAPVISARGLSAREVRSELEERI